MAGPLAPRVAAAPGLRLRHPRPHHRPCRGHVPPRRGAKYQRRDCSAEEMIAAMPQRPKPIFVCFPFILPELQYLCGFSKLHAWRTSVWGVKHPHTCSEALGFAFTSSLTVRAGLPLCFPLPAVPSRCPAPRVGLCTPPAEGASPSTPPRCPRPRPRQVRAVTGGKPGGAGGKCKPAVIKGIFQTARCAELFRDTAGTDVHVPDPRRTRYPAPPPLWKDSEMIQPEECWPSARLRVSAVISLGCLCLQLCAWKRNRGRHRRPGEGEQSPPARCHRAVPCSCSTSAGPGW